MTPFTLITVAALVVAGAFLSVGVVLALALVWQGRRIGDVATVRADLDTLRAEHRNLDEIFESYRTRNAQRVSSAVQRSKKETEESPAPPPIVSRDDIVRRFNDQRSNSGTG